MNEAVRLVEEGVATPEDVDRAFKAGMGFRYASIGIFEFIDWGGVDILYRASRYMTEATGDERFRPARLVEEKMARNELGPKTGPRLLRLHRATGARRSRPRRCGRCCDACDRSARDPDRARHDPHAGPPSGGSSRDGSVLVDGRDVVQVGPAASVRPPRTTGPGDRRPPLRGGAGLRRHARAPDRAPEPRPDARRRPGAALPARLAAAALLDGDAGGGAGGRAAGLRGDDPHRDHDVLRGGHALRRGRGRRRRRAGGHAGDPRPVDVGPRRPARPHEADDGRGAGAHGGHARQGERPRRRPPRRLAAAARLRHLLGGADPAALTRWPGATASGGG